MTGEIYLQTRFTLTLDTTHLHSSHLRTNAFRTHKRRHMHQNWQADKLHESFLICYLITKTLQHKPRRNRRPRTYGAPITCYINNASSFHTTMVTHTSINWLTSFVIRDFFSASLKFYDSDDSNEKAEDIRFFGGYRRLLQRFTSS